MLSGKRDAERGREKTHSAGFLIKLFMACLFTVIKLIKYRLSTSNLNLPWDELHFINSRRMGKKYEEFRTASSRVRVRRTKYVKVFTKMQGGKY